jgi:hypothetical protein
MHFPQQPSLPRTQGMADSAIDAAWAIMPPDMDLETADRLPSSSARIEAASWCALRSARSAGSSC